MALCVCVCVCSVHPYARLVIEWDDEMSELVSDPVVETGTRIKALSSGSMDVLNYVCCGRIRINAVWTTLLLRILQYMCGVNVSASSFIVLAYLHSNFYTLFHRRAKTRISKSLKIMHNKKMIISRLLTSQSFIDHYQESPFYQSFMLSLSLLLLSSILFIFYLNFF